MLLKHCQHFKSVFDLFIVVIDLNVTGLLLGLRRYAAGGHETAKMVFGDSEHGGPE